jgi:hypothetical protein
LRVMLSGVKRSEASQNGVGLKRRRRILETPSSAGRDSSLGCFTPPPRRTNNGSVGDPVVVQHDNTEVPSDGMHLLGNCNTALPGSLMPLET